MKRTGEILRAAREKLGLSLVEVSMATKINTKILTALEAGDESHLPARTFLRGFIRSYANHLKLDAETVLQVYQEETGTTPVSKTPSSEAEAPAANKESATTPKSSLPDIEARSRTIKTFTIVGIFILILLIIVVRNLVEKYEKEGVVETPTAAVSALAAPSASPQPSESMEAAIEIPPVVTSPSPVPVASPSPAHSVPAKPSPTPKPSPKASPSPKPSPIESSNATAAIPASTPSAVPSPKPSPSKKKDAENEIIIEALDKVILKFKINDGEPTDITLQPDQVHTIKTKGVVTVDVSDGGAIDVIVNGRDRGVPGDLGKPKTIKLP